MKKEKSSKVVFPNFCTRMPFYPLDCCILGAIAEKCAKHLDMPYLEFGFQTISNLGFTSLLVSDLVDKITLIGNYRKFHTLYSIFDIEPKSIQEMPLELRLDEIRENVLMLNDGYVKPDLDRNEIAKRVNKALTDYMEERTGIRFETSDRIRGFGVLKILYPFALAGNFILGSEVYLFNSQSGVLNPFIIGHEFAHRKNRFKELDAQVWAYLSLLYSNDPILVQGAKAGRLRSQLLSVASIVDKDKNRAQAEETKAEAITAYRGLRPELKTDFDRSLIFPLYKRVLAGMVFPIYGLYLLLTKQRPSDYNSGFTNFLHALELKKE